MLSFGLKNLRLLESVPPIEMRPITLLVGRNSSGKSTFLRASPLLRQSVTTRTSSPILWYGDWVDFGAFESAVFGKRTELNVSFIFNIDLVTTARKFADYSYVAKKFDHVFVELNVCKHKSGTRISSIQISEKTNDSAYHLDIDEDGKASRILIGKEDVSRVLEDWSIRLTPGSILPQAIVVQSAASASPSFDPTYAIHPVTQAICKLVSPKLDKRIKDESLTHLVHSLFFMGAINKENILRQSTAENKSWHKLLVDICGQDKNQLYPQIRLFLLMANLPQLLNATTRVLRNIIEGTLYIGPARSRSDRYYRYQDLAVSEIDPDGKNFPMFLNSLTDAQINKFSSWVKSLFGYGVTVSKQQGHISINLVYESSTSNIVDTGYGVSQILPVLGQVWWASNQPRARLSASTEIPYRIIGIEQPELHLHPAHQALLADAFCSGLQLRSSRGALGGICFLLETHSETMINRFGTLVYEKKLSPENIQIILFESSDDDEEKKINVRVSTFDEEGSLINWPYGFFLPKSS